jgi:hypothetical protein
MDQVKIRDGDAEILRRRPTEPQIYFYGGRGGPEVQKARGCHSGSGKLFHRMVRIDVNANNFVLQVFSQENNGILNATLVNQMVF